MVFSMTGYGRAKSELNGRGITVEIKSVNHRYFEYSARIPRGLGSIDDKLKQVVAREISRGKLEMNIALQETAAEDVYAVVNLPLAKSYAEQLTQLAYTLSLSGAVTISDIARLPDVLSVSKTEADIEEIFADIKLVLLDALNEFKKMRAEEGKKLKTDIIEQLCLIEKSIEEIRIAAEDGVSEYTRKLYDKLTLLLADKSIDESRILTEAAIFADKTDTNEELVRLQSHIEQFIDVLEVNEPKGRKLDFLTQEMNREVNTIGSKIQNLELTKLVIDMKSQLEKIREQIQNIE